MSQVRTATGELAGGDVDELLPGDLLRLEQETGGSRLSLFLPLSSRSGRTRGRAADLLAEAGQALRSDGLPGAEVADLMSRVGRTVARTRPVSEKHLGLAVFADPDRVRAYRLPVRPSELAVVGDRFALSPLLPAVNVQRSYVLLALTQDDIRVFTGTALALERRDVTGLELAAWTTMPRPRAPRGHAFLGSRGAAGTRAVFPGAGRGSAERATRLRQHFRGTDLALREVLTGDGRPPLVLAGARDLQDAYRAVNTYPHLIRHGIDGNPAQLTCAELHRHARALIEPELRRAAAAVLTRYSGLRGTGRTVGDLEDCLRAARDGQVETLLVDESACTWKRSGQGRPVLRLGSLPAGAEQLESAVLATLASDGTVFVVPAGQLPERSPAVAIARS